MSHMLPARQLAYYLSRQMIIGYPVRLSEPIYVFVEMLMGEVMVVVVFGYLHNFMFV